VHGASDAGVIEFLLTFGTPVSGNTVMLRNSNQHSSGKIAINKKAAL
jgi:hypothetical protein